MPDGCRLLSRRLSKENGEPAKGSLPHGDRLDAGHNAYRISNTVECDAELTLVKEVDGGEADPIDWALRADGPGWRAAAGRPR